MNDILFSQWKVNDLVLYLFLILLCICALIQIVVIQIAVEVGTWISDHIHVVYLITDLKLKSVNDFLFKFGHA